MLDTLKGIPLLQDLNQEQLDLITPLFEVFACPANQIIFNQNDQATHLYLLIKGTVALTFKPYDGAQIVLTRLHAGDVFGWSSVVGGSAYTSGICSETGIEAVRIRGRDLRKLCRDHPDLGALMLDRLAEAVAVRWKDSRQQVQAILHRNLARQGKQKSE
ncbi:MAG TPA: cyclic nucleotide-binding domain-containing protein [Anaerolineales bacterium]|nr:cyclic nucleotide-binding domain-containing protein [Anaerolineales bacterium]